MKTPTNEAGNKEDPEGSIFLPEGSENLTLREIGRLKLAVMLKRGREASDLEPHEQAAAYGELIELEKRHLGRVATRPEV